MNTLFLSLNIDCKCTFPPPAVPLVAQRACAGEEARVGGAAGRLVSQTPTTSHPSTPSASDRRPSGTAGATPHSASWTYKDAAETSGVVVLEVIVGSNLRCVFIY